MSIEFLNGFLKRATPAEKNSNKLGLVMRTFKADKGLTAQRTQAIYDYLSPTGVGNY